jgi:hypothetical protein
LGSATDYTQVSPHDHRLMPALRSLPWLFVALLVFASLHCASGHEITVGSDGVPHKHCHDESGCICKGATLVDPVTLDAPLDVVAWLAILHEFAPVEALLQAQPLSPNHLAAPPPLSGMALRARLESLVI